MKEQVEKHCRNTDERGSRKKVRLAVCAVSTRIKELGQWGEYIRKARQRGEMREHGEVMSMINIKHESTKMRVESR